MLSSANRARNTSGSKAGLDAFRLSALDVAADLGEPGREPSDDVEAVQHVAGVAEVGVDGGLVGLGAVADDDFDSACTICGLVASETSDSAAERCGAGPSPGCGRCRR